MDRVVVSGRGLVTPLGVGLPANEDGLRKGRSGIVVMEKWRTLGMESHVAGVANQDPECPLLDIKRKRFTGPNSRMAAAAAWQAMVEAGLGPDDLKGGRCAMVNGCAGGAYQEIYDSSKAFEETGKLRKVSPFIVPRVMPSSAVSNLSLILGVTGETYDVSSACTSGAHAILLGARLVQSGAYDMVLAGGSEELSWVQTLGFTAMRALSTKYNDRPDKASRPFDKDRDGFVIAEGAGMVILERESHARARGAVPKAVLSGWAMNSNASDMVVPSAESSAAVMSEAVKNAGLKPSDIGYVNTHGTGTPIGDPVEMEAIRMVFGGGAAVNSTKSMTGHMIGATGAVEAIYCAMMMEKKFICGSLNLDNPEDGLEWADLVRSTRDGSAPRHSISNSFGFGGSNACMVISAVE